MIEVDTQCPDCGHGESDHLEALPSERRTEPRHSACLVCGCRRYLGGARDEIGEYKADRRAEEVD